MFEVIMRTTVITNSITTKSWFYNSIAHATNKLDNNLPSRFENILLLDSDSQISALNLPAYTMTPISAPLRNVYASFFKICQVIQERQIFRESHCTFD